MSGVLPYTHAFGSVTSLSRAAALLRYWRSAETTEPIPARLTKHPKPLSSNPKLEEKASASHSAKAAFPDGQVPTLTPASAEWLNEFGKDANMQHRMASEI
ncbi:uncharacterized protein LAESUDRAFT_758025 [Laetiporus sulphureus 93-53]|uniref:Uncharacterized protein n=1 Tax=Laetiporus sulphureus 93-53 TaxID=1314785 RepID=A0A165EW20_9APHY|nr:uncharacterized protein LAESUDRAFT_758025 [Laetiporus sulphureus 93-53]KZT07888.1 hypothetical protein LAESUDRAFT_758025 [Laetiporus sulphureus 93-53]